MAVVWTILLWLLLLLLGLLLAVLLLPFHGRARGRVSADTADMADMGDLIEGEAVVRWAWGLVALRAAVGEGAALYLLGLRCGRQRGKKAASAREGGDDASNEKNEKKKKKKRGKGRRALRALLDGRASLSRIVRRLVRALRIRGSLTGSVGLGDPADTALLRAWVETIATGRRGVRVGLCYDYLEETIDLEARLRARVWVIHLGAVAVAGLFARDVRQVLRALR